VKKKVSYTWIHKDKKMLSTWMHVGGVMEYDYLTSKQTQKSNATAERSLFLLQFCGNSKTAPPT
jgi:hypothetical protein